MFISLPKLFNFHRTTATTRYYSIAAMFLTNSNLNVHPHTFSQTQNLDSICLPFCSFHSDNRIRRWIVNNHLLFSTFPVELVAKYFCRKHSSVHSQLYLVITRVNDILNVFGVEFFKNDHFEEVLEWREKLVSSFSANLA